MGYFHTKLYLHICYQMGAAHLGPSCCTLSLEKIWVSISETTFPLTFLGKHKETLFNRCLEEKMCSSFWHYFLKARTHPQPLVTTHRVHIKVPRWENEWWLLYCTIVYPRAINTGETSGGSRHEKNGWSFHTRISVAWTHASKDRTGLTGEKEREKSHLETPMELLLSLKQNLLQQFSHIRSNLPSFYC